MIPLQNRAAHVTHVVEACNAGVGRHVIELLEGLARLNTCKLSLIYSPSRADRRFLAGLRVLQTLNVQVYPLPIARRLSLAQDLRAVWQLSWLLRRMAPIDLLHTHSGKAGVVGRVAGLLRGIPNVHTPNGLGFLSAESAMARRLYRAAERVLGRTSAKLVAVSEEEAALVLEGGLARPDACIVIPNGVPESSPTGDANLRTEFGISTDELVIGAVGRLDRQKNPELFVNTAIRVIQSGTQNCHFVWIGDGPLSVSLGTLIRDSGLSERVHLAGFREDAELCYAEFDVFLLTSRYEGMSYSMLEAMRAGLPIIAPRIEGVGSGVGDTGVLLETRDPEAWAREVRHCLGDRELRASLGASARRRFNDYFGLRNMVARTAEVYSGLIRRSM